jgi:hypothetical protein
MAGTRFGISSASVTENFGSERREKGGGIAVATSMSFERLTATKGRLMAGRIFLK